LTLVKGRAGDHEIAQPGEEIIAVIVGERALASIPRAAARARLSAR